MTDMRRIAHERAAAHELNVKALQKLLSFIVRHHNVPETPVVHSPGRRRIYRQADRGRRHDCRGALLSRSSAAGCRQTRHA